MLPPNPWARPRIARAPSASIKKMECRIWASSLTTWTAKGGPHKPKSGPVDDAKLVILLLLGIIYMISGTTHLGAWFGISICQLSIFTLGIVGGIVYAIRSRCCRQKRQKPQMRQGIEEATDCLWTMVFPSNALFGQNSDVNPFRGVGGWSQSGAKTFRANTYTYTL